MRAHIEIMSQATLIGLYSNNVVTILQPSSTIECTINDYVVPPTTVSFTSSTTINKTGRLDGYVTIPIVSASAVGFVRLQIGATFVSQIPVPSSFSQSIVLPFSVVGPAAVTVTHSGSVALGSLSLTYA